MTSRGTSLGSWSEASPWNVIVVGGIGDPRHAGNSLRDGDSKRDVGVCSNVPGFPGFRSGDDVYVPVTHRVVNPG